MLGAVQDKMGVNVGKVDWGCGVKIGTSFSPFRFCCVGLELELLPCQYLANLNSFSLIKPSPYDRLHHCDSE